MRSLLTWLRWWRRPKYWAGPDLEYAGALIAGLIVVGLIALIIFVGWVWRE